MNIPHKAKGLCTKCYGHIININLGKKQQFTCLNCGEIFSPKFHASNNHRKFCCHKCSVQYHTGKTRGVETDKENVHKRLITAVQKAGAYLPQKELLHKAHMCYNTMRKYGFNAPMINFEAGFSKDNSTSEQLAYNYLKHFIPDLIAEKTFEDCRSLKGYKLRFDLYSKKMNLLIEIDCSYHHYSTKRTMIENQLINDKLKNLYAKEHNIQMVRIPVKDHTKVSQSDIAKALPELCMGNQQPSFADNKYALPAEKAQRPAERRRHKRAETRGLAKKNASKDMVLSA